MYKHAAFIYEQKNTGITKLLIFGGQNNLKKFETVHEFDFSTKRWTLLQTKNTQLLKARFAYSACMSHYEDKVYLFGGSQDSKLLNDALKYDVVT